MANTPRWTSIEEREALRAAACALPAPAAPSAGLEAHGHVPPGADVRARSEPPEAGHASQGDPSGAPDEPGRWSRRTFLTATGFSMAGALAACGRPSVRRAAPGAAQPEEVVQGRSTWYATTCGGCPAGCGLLVKARDGRPIKVEGNPDHPISKGGVCAVGQAQVLGLYDSKRLFHPRVDGAETSWASTDARVVADLERVRKEGGAVRIVTGTVTSPTTQAWTDALLRTFADGRHVVTDALSASAVLAAHARTHGARILPRYRFERAEVIVAVEADFLGTWISPVEFTKGWRAGRTLAGTPPRLSFHAQVESAMTLTGTNADRRVRLEAGQAGPFVAHLARGVAARTGGLAPEPVDPCPVPASVIDALVDRLAAARGRALVVCGTNDVGAQVLVNAMNEALGAYGATLDLAAPSRQRAGDDGAFEALVAEMEAGKVAAIVVAGANPVADGAGGARFGAALAKVPVRIGLAERSDETTAMLAVVLPAPHPLESWDDGEPVAGVLTVAQPLITAFGEPRTLRECFAAWTGTPAKDLALLKAAWRKDQHPRQAAEASFERFWTTSVRDGFVQVSSTGLAVNAFDRGAVAAAKPRGAPIAPGRFALAAVPCVSMLDGRHAQNPWLQELPDPVTKQVWGNAALLSEAGAGALGVRDGDVVRLSVGGRDAVDLPVLVQPGLADRTVVVALGFGRAGTDRFASIGPRWIEGKPTVEQGGTVGANVARLLRFSPAGGGVAYAGAEVSIERTGRREDVAKSQTYGSLDMPANTSPRHGEHRDHVRETTLVAFAKDASAGNPKPEHGGDLWPKDFAYAGHRWRMEVDLSACTGCGACVVACQAENNVAVVGKDEVLRRRDMAWMRIDRYYADVPGSPGDVEVVHQPMLCQHCENAPCETVCPVLATAHSSEGLNAQVYNRCVGTRYCANNCPYKVRRFNWFDYASHDSLADLVLNPDVTVRTRGVMEKCSFCVQRLHEAKAEAKVEGRPLADGDAKTACQQSCPATAIVFGDASDPKSAISEAVKSPRHYHVLEELNVKPSVGYLTKVRHREGGGEGASRG